MAEEAAAHHLLNVIEERELDVDLDGVLAAFEDGVLSKDAAAWVNVYLDEANLLTREELELYRELKKKGLLQQYQNGIDSDNIQPILDRELSAAVESLQNSTAAIEEQCKVLEAQRDALMKLKALDKPDFAVEHIRNERRRKEHQEKGRLDVAVDDVTTSINEQVSDAQRDVDSEKATLKSYIKDRLASDDKILTALPGIVSKILTGAETIEDEKSVNQWCDAIISFRTAEIRSRVDAVYLENLKQSNPDKLPKGSEDELRVGKEELQNELETLHSEIASVAEMVVEHELRKPMNEMKERKERESAQARSSWLQYVLSTLDFMSKRLDTITSHTHNITQYQQALKRMHAEALKRAPETHPAPSSPSKLKRAHSSNAKSPFPTIKLKPTQSIALPPALQDALRHAGLSFNSDSIDALRSSLMETQLQREKKLAEHYASATRSTHDQLSERLGKADTDTNVILDALYAHTPFATVQLRDPVVERKIAETEGKIEDAEMQLLGLEASELSLGDPKVKAFVEKYGK